MNIEITETLTGWNVIRTCPVCNDSCVFVHNSKDKNRAVTAVNLKFDEIHLDCNYNSAVELGGV